MAIRDLLLHRREQPVNFMKAFLDLQTSMSGISVTEDAVNLYYYLKAKSVVGQICSLLSGLQFSQRAQTFLLCNHIFYSMRKSSATF